MDLRGIANAGSSTVNPNTTVTVFRSNGYSLGAGARQVPSYDAPVTGYAQIQALDASDIKQLDGLNIQGTIRALYLRGSLAGVIRPDGKGGDIIHIADKEWLVVRVLESWSDWTKVAIVLQGARTVTFRIFDNVFSDIFG
jgi:hypothetical protein